MIPSFNYVIGRNSSGYFFKIILIDLKNGNILAKKPVFVSLTFKTEEDCRSYLHDVIKLNVHFAGDQMKANVSEYIKVMKQKEGVMYEEKNLDS